MYEAKGVSKQAGMQLLPELRTVISHCKSHIIKVQKCTFLKISPFRSDKICKVLRIAVFHHNFN